MPITYQVAPISALFSAVLCLAICFLVQSPEIAFGQNSYLPKAGFPAYAGGDMAPSGGVHLGAQGLNRKNNGSAQPYDPGEPSLNGALVRWDQSRMPLKIWISPGLKLPDPVPGASFETLQNMRVKQVYDLLHDRSGQALSRLATARDWTPETNYYTANGIEQWRRFQEEGLIRFGFVDDPKQADILVFYSDGFNAENAPSGVSIGGITYAQIFPIAQIQSMQIQHTPVVIELSTAINGSPERMQAASAHEFGHALGIKAHSPYREDLMFVDRVAQELSPADIATFRYLYHKNPQYLMW